jgi:hypothetical protein
VGFITRPQLRNHHGTINIFTGWQSLCADSWLSGWFVDDCLFFPPTSHVRVSEWFGWVSS